jgi:hypothetical protein
MMRKKREAVTRRESRQFIGKNQIACEAQILRPDKSLSGWDCLGQTLQRGADSATNHLRWRLLLG